MCVCYVRNVPLRIVTQPKKRDYEYFTHANMVSIFIILYKTICFWVSSVLENQLKLSASVNVCVYVLCKNDQFVIVTKPQKKKYGFVYNGRIYIYFIYSTKIRGIWFPFYTPIYISIILQLYRTMFVCV